MSVDGIINEQYTNFVGKDGFYWWVGEVEDNEDPMQLGRVKARVLNYYTNPLGGSSEKLPTENLPWATVLQTTDQAGNDGQGASSGALQPGAIVMGFFLDGESAQMPIVMGVLRINKVGTHGNKKKFLFTGKDIIGSPNKAHGLVGSTNDSAGEYNKPIENNSVPMPGQGTDKTQTSPVTKAGPNSVATKLPGSVSGNPGKPPAPEPDAPIPAASGTGGPWKTLEYQLKYLVQDLIDTASNLVKSEKGDFLNVVENKIVTAEQLMSKIKNFLSAVFAQVVSALRLQLDKLAQDLEKASFLTSFTGIPSSTFVIIQSAISLILSLICGIDQQIIAFINAPVASLLNIVNSLLDGLIDAASAAIQSVEQLIDSILCSVQGYLTSALSIVNQVKDVVSTVGDAKEIIDGWEKGNQIFNGKFDLKNLSVENIISILTTLMTLFDFGCDREAHGGEDTVGWFPFFGTTSCTPFALSSIPMGSPRKGCGGSGSGSFIDSFFDEASPYLSAAKTFINGAYQLQLGTPGREATITRSASGTTHTSIRANNEALARHKATEAVKAQTKGKDVSEEDKNKAIEKYVKKQTKTNTTVGDQTADHVSYGGNLTQTVPEDDCKTVGGDYCRTIQGDYRLKVTGDLHLEVGGGFFMNAQGAPKQTDKRGADAKNKNKIQKHTISFGSDVDMVVNGANLKMQSTQMTIGARDLGFTGSSFKNECKVQTLGCGEFIVNAGNSVKINTTTMIQNVNFAPPKPGFGNYTVAVGGPITFKQIPGGLTKIPPFTVTTPGPFLVTAAAGGVVFTVKAGGFVATVAKGAVALTASAGAVTVTAKAGAMTLTAGAAMVCTAKVIKLN